MAEAVADILHHYNDNLANVPKGIQLNEELKGLIARNHELNQQLVIGKGYAELKQQKRLLLINCADGIKNQLLLFASMENRPDLKARVDLYYADLFHASGDKLIDFASVLLNEALALGAELDDYRGAGITTTTLDESIKEFRALLSSTRMNIATRSAINKEITQNIINLRELLNDRIDVAMKIIRNNDTEFYDAYTMARVIVDRHGKRNEKAVEQDAISS